jgi:hypothetical protein
LGTIVGPVLVAFSALGWTQFVRSLRPSTARVVLYGVGAVGSVGAVLLLLGNIRTSLDYVDNRQQQAVFSVSYDVDQAVAWGRQYGGADGDELNVLTDSYIDRLWLAQQLVDRPLTSFPYLTGDYFFTWSYVDRQPRRYLLASRDILTTFPPGSIVEANAGYVLYDTSRTAGVVISPTTNWFEGEGTRDDHIQWMSNDGDVVVMRWSPTEPVQVELKSVPTLERVGIDVVGEGEEDLGSMVVTSTSTWHPLDLPDGYVAYVRFENAPPAVPPGNGDARPLSVGLQDVTSAG